VAGLQGAYFLVKFRQNHKDAPRPASPSRGLVIVSPFDNVVVHSSTTYDDTVCDSSRTTTTSSSSSSTTSWRKRILMRKNNIQSTLNDDTYPKPTRWWWSYYWRGTIRHGDHKSMMEKQIPLSLLVVGDSLAAGVGSTSGTPKLPEAIARSLSKALGGRPVYWTCHGTPGAATSQIMKDIEKIIEKTNEEREKRTILEVFQSTIRSFHVWVQTIRHRMSTTVTATDTAIDRDTGITAGQKQHLPVVMKEKHADMNERQEINKWERIRTRFSVHANVNGKEMGQFDVVVVLTGLNDLKGIFLPFLQDESGVNQHGFKEELRKVFMVLSEKMKLQISKMKKSTDGSIQKQESHKVISNDKNGNETSLECRPLVVIPALPTRPVPMLQYPPLSWFVHLLLELLDEEKRSLSKEYPDDILFVEAPSIEMIHEIEKGQSILIAKRKAEKLLLDLKDITRQVRDKIEHLIREHVDIHGQSESESETEMNYEASHHNNLTNRMPDHVGSKLISFDRVHPNDDGYDFWGRHIAESIINAWRHPSCHGYSYENHVHSTTRKI